MASLNPGLLAAIIADPDSDELRLIYADWLEERGDPRGEFIRVQVEIARGEVYPCERFCADANGLLDRRAKDCFVCRPCLLRRRQWELFSPEWVPFIIVLNTDYGYEGNGFSKDFRRGFIESIRCTSETWIKHTDAIRASTPLREVELTTVPEDMAEMGTVAEIVQPNSLQLKSWPGITFTLPTACGQYRYGLT